MLDSFLMALSANGWKQLGNVYTLIGLLVLAVGQPYYELTGNGGWSYWYGMLLVLTGSLFIPPWLESTTDLSLGRIAFGILSPMVAISAFVLLLRYNVSQDHVVDAFMSVIGLSVTPWLYLVSLVYKRW